MNSKILQGADHLKSRSIAHVRKPGIFMSAEVSLKDPAVISSVEDCTPSLKFSYSVGRFFCVKLGHSPIVQVLSAPHSVSEVHFPVITVINICQRSSTSTFCHHCVCLAQE